MLGHRMVGFNVDFLLQCSSMFLIRSVFLKH
jgi:hypothetical protein